MDACLSGHCGHCDTCLSAAPTTLVWDGPDFASTASATGSTS